MESSALHLIPVPLARLNQSQLAIDIEETKVKGFI